MSSEVGKATVPVVLFPGPPGSATDPGRSPSAQVPRTPAELASGLERIRDVFTSREPPELRTGLVPVEDGREMLVGTTTLALPNRFVARPSGLLIPAGAVPMPLELASAYLTGDEVFGVAPSPALTMDQLATMPFSKVLGLVAGTLAAHRRPGVPPERNDREFAERWLAGPARERVRNLLRNPLRRLIVPQALYVLIKLAAEYCPDALLPDVEPGRLAIVMYGALGALDAEHEAAGAEGLVIDTEVGPLTSRLVANQHLNKPLDEDHRMARFVRQWLELPAERAAERRVLDLEKAFADTTGVSLRDVVVVATALWARAAIGEPCVPADYFADLGWSSDRLKAALRLFSMDPVTLRGLLRQELRDHSLAWSFSTLEQYPVIRLDDGAFRSTRFPPSCCVSGCAELACWPAWTWLRSRSSTRSSRR